MEQETKVFAPVNRQQEAFLNSIKRYLLMSGAVGAGKSYIGLLKGLMNNMRYPGNRGLVCRKEAASMTGSTLKTLFEQILPADWIVSYNQQKGELWHRTTIDGVLSSIFFSGLDKKASQQYPTKIGSTEYGWIFVDEGTELELGEWEMLSTRLRFQIKRYTKKQNDIIPRQLFTATNPDAPTHWMHKFFFESKDEDRKYYLTTPYDNPKLPKGYLRFLENTLTGIQRDRLLHGKWVGAEGLIYKSFDINKHLTDEKHLLQEVYPDQSTKFNIRLYKQVIFCADANYPLPRAGLIIGIKGEGHVDIIDEFYQENAHVENLIDWLKPWVEKLGRGIQGYHDPSDPDAIDTINKAPGLICDKADNKVIPGISEVARYFDKDLIKINKTCVNLIKELQSYAWKKNAEGESPIKKDDHLVDALRYGLNSIKQSPIPSRGRAIF